LAPNFFRQRLKIEPVHRCAARSTRAFDAYAEELHRRIDVAIAALPDCLADLAS